MALLSLFSRKGNPGFARGGGRQPWVGIRGRGPASVPELSLQKPNPWEPALRQGLEPSGGGGAVGGASGKCPGLQPGIRGRPALWLWAPLCAQTPGVPSLPTSWSPGHWPGGKVMGVPGDTDHADHVRTFRLRCLRETVTLSLFSSLWAHPVPPPRATQSSLSPRNRYFGAYRVEQ